MQAGLVHAEATFIFTTLVNHVFIPLHYLQNPMALAKNIRVGMIDEFARVRTLQ